MTEQQAITTMFDGIAPRYDFLNRLLSFHMDTLWRRKLSKHIAKSHPSAILDVATGTADLAIQMAKDIPSAQVTGLDLSQTMLQVGQEKINRKHLNSRISLLHGDAQQLPFPDHSFDAVTVAFGIRNFENLSQGLSEIHRVVKPGGTIGILEFSKTTKFPMRPLYRFYSKHLIPIIGRIISRHPSAYTYLPESIEAFHSPNELVALLKELGMNTVRARRLCGGIATIYQAKV